MPGGQYTNLRQQAKSLGLEGRWREIAEAYATVNQLFGDIVKVTPSSKVVGDMALFMVTNNLTAMDVLSPGKKLNFPKRVVERMQGARGWQFAEGAAADHSGFGRGEADQGATWGEDGEGGLWRDAQGHRQSLSL